METESTEIKHIKHSLKLQGFHAVPFHSTEYEIWQEWGEESSPPVLTCTQSGEREGAVTPHVSPNNIPNPSRCPSVQQGRASLVEGVPD